MQEHIQNELASFIANCDWEKMPPIGYWTGLAALWPESTIPK